jgi:O-antigen/teichoic acid export membrane protein
MSAGLLIFAYYKYHENIIRWRFSLSVMKKLLQDSWPLILSSMMILLYMRVDQFMIGELLGDAEVGIYSSAIRLTEVWYFIPTAIVSSVFPSIIDAKRRDESLYNYRLQQLYTTMTWIGIAIALPMTFLSDFVIKLLYGDEFAGAGAVLSISIWCGIFVFQGIARGYWLLTENLQKYSLIYIGGACVLNIVLNLFLIPMLHSVGAAIATTISYGCSVIFFPLFIRQTKKSSIQILKSFIWKMN